MNEFYSMIRRLFMYGGCEKVERRKLSGKHIALSLLISVQLLFPIVVSVHSAEAEDVAGAFDPIADKIDPDSYIRTAGGVAIQLEKRMPEYEATTASTAPDAGSEVVQPGVSASPEPQVGRPETSTPPPADLVMTTTTPLEEPEDPFKSASPDVPELKDPFVKYNRFMYNVNDHIYEYFMDPIARRYRDWVDEDARISIRNVFNNASSAVKFVSSLVQGDLNKMTRVIGRLIINSSIGIGGLFDVADKHFHIDDVHEDFGQALGYHKIPTGPYVVLPFLGPATARDLAGRVVDSFLSPSIMFAPGFVVGTGISMTDKVNGLSFILEDKKGLDESAVDEYESIRDFYHQYREGLVRK